MLVTHLPVATAWLHSCSNTKHALSYRNTPSCSNHLNYTASTIPKHYLPYCNTPSWRGWLGHTAVVMPVPTKSSGLRLRHYMGQGAILADGNRVLKGMRCRWHKWRPLWVLIAQHCRRLSVCPHNVTPLCLRLQEMTHGYSGALWCQ